MKQETLIFTITLLIITSCNTQNDGIIFQNNSVQIEGNIEEYKKIYKTGQLTYFDAVTRIVKDEIFVIDSTGNFVISFDLLHPIIGSIYFDIENNFYSNFYIEPNTKYNISIKGDRLIFNGETGKINNEISMFYDSLYAILGTEIQEMNSLHNEGLPIEEYISIQKNTEKEKMEFLFNFSNKYPLTKKAFKVLESDIKFKTAHAWINYRYDYSATGRPILRDTLPPDFYKNLFQEYSITNNVDYQTRNGIDFISNIVSSLIQKENDVENRIEFIKSNNYFTENELILLSKLYNGDKDVRNSAEYAEFNNQVNMTQIRNLSFRFNIKNVLKSINQLKQNIGRDLIISQALSENYFSNNMTPTTSEWGLIDSLVANKSLLTYLHTFSSLKTAKEKQKNAENEIVKTNIEQVKKKYIDKYLGNVVYIDFYTTWCSPCRNEIPYAKALHHEFNDTDVVFLNLCAKSNEEDWNYMIKQKDIDGENYFLNNEEFNLLSKVYNVEGFPTYILVDKKGNVSNYKAPRPSSKKTIIDEINTLLE